MFNSRQRVNLRELIHDEINHAEKAAGQSVRLSLVAYPRRLDFRPQLFTVADARLRKNVMHVHLH